MKPTALDILRQLSRHGITMSPSASGLHLVLSPSELVTDRVCSTVLPYKPVILRLSQTATVEYRRCLADNCTLTLVLVDGWAFCPVHLMDEYWKNRSAGGWDSSGRKTFEQLRARF
jgi:hypothetical protein